MAPVLFSLYFGAVVDDWRGKWSTSGVEFRHKHGCKIISDRIAKFRLLLDFTQFTDDTTLYATTMKDFVTMTEFFANIVSSWGLTVSLVKSKGIKIGNEPSF